GSPASKTDPDGHGILDFALRTVGIAGDAATVADSGKTLLSSKSTVSDRIGATLNIASIVLPALAVQKVDMKAESDKLEDRLGIKQEKVQLHDVGTAADLKSRSEPGDGLDIHHAPQAHAAEQSIAGYDKAKGPAIAVTEAEHAALNTKNIKG